MTAFLDGYYLNTEKVEETKGVCFDNLTFSAGPEFSSLFPWVLGVEEGGGQVRAGGAWWPLYKEKGVQAFLLSGWPFQLHKCRN